MLIEFSVANFRSFRERQTLRMSAAPRLSRKENTFAPEVSGETLPDLLKVAAIYGANASGKSNLTMALDVIPKLLRRRPDATTRPLPVDAFRFDAALKEKPSQFEIHFVAAGTRYAFRVEATHERITYEALTAYPRGHAEALYVRRFVQGKYTYSFGESIEGGVVVLNAWCNLTGPQTLFISQAVANSSEQMMQLRIPFTWLQHGVLVLSDNLSGMCDYGRKLPIDEEWAKRIATFLHDVDVPVTDIRFEPVEESVQAEADGSDADTSLRRKNGKTTLTHKTRLGTAAFDFFEESRGTRNLIGLWLPLSINSSNDNPACRVLVIDEFDSSLHPELVANLVRKHQKANTNTQLVFTTHDTHLMSANLLRRDQFWITDRDGNGATRLCSVQSYEGREAENIEQRYFEGRYRGLPIRRRK